MEKNFWMDRWSDNRIGFHLSDVNPWLLEHGGTLPQGRTLVPLCGKTLDMRFLAEGGHDVFGVEFVPEAAHAFFKENNLSYTTAEVAGGMLLTGKLASRAPSEADAGTAQAGDGPGADQPGRVSIWVGDFFSPELSALGPFESVYDRAAVVAINPDNLGLYFQQLGNLCAPGAEVLMVAFDHDTGDGPPFSVPTDTLDILGVTSV